MLKWQRNLKRKKDNIIFMGKKYDSCIKSVKSNIKSGKISRDYKKGGKRIKTNAYALCSKLK